MSEFELSKTSKNERKNSAKTLILAIESSCDDSSLAIIDKESLECVFEKKISQEKEHFEFGGVVPELASRLHTAALPKILKECKPYFNKLCAVAVTAEPGLSVSLLGGITMAKMLAGILNLPLIAINHLLGHIYSLFLDKKIELNLGVLLVSGGHTLVLFVDEKGEISILAQTLDDSFGESFDKVAKMMDLGYPGGAVVQDLALRADEKKLHFSVPLLHSKQNDFSFSGLKNQVRVKIEELKSAGLLDEKAKQEIAFSFEEAAVSHILNKLERIFKHHPFTQFAIVGGASANLKLRSRVESLCKKFNCKLLLAPLSHCADNALMIARAGVESFKKGEFISISEDILSTKSTNLQHI